MAADINGQQVGTFSINRGAFSLAISFSGFGPISGPAYDIALVVVNTVPSGGDTVSLIADGSSSSATLSGVPAAIPVPAALPLFATGLGALGLLSWRRKRKA